MNDLFDDSISEQRLIESMRSLRVPRHLFKFMYHLLVRHCNDHTDQNPVWINQTVCFSNLGPTHVIL